MALYPDINCINRLIHCIRLLIDSINLLISGINLLVLVSCGTNLIVGILRHDSYWPASQPPANQSASHQVINQLSKRCARNWRPTQVGGLAHYVCIFLGMRWLDN